MSTYHSMTATPAPKPRIAYIDALRGFTMLLVVYHHTCGFGYHLLHEEFITFNSFFIKSRMPLFFFISGWVLYNNKRIWDNSTCKAYLRKKFNVQIVSTIIFCVLYVYLFKIDILYALGNLKAGYWFTYTLFLYFCFYILSVWLSNRIRNNKYEDIFVVGSAFLVFIIYYISIKDKQPNHIQIFQILGTEQWVYYSFFCFGSLVKKYFKGFVKMTDNSDILAVIICSFFAIILFEDFFFFSYAEIIKFFFSGFLGIIIIFTVFRKNANWFDSNRNVSQWMQYIGRHTLDIYLLHFFFLPRNLQMIGEFFKSYPNPTIELIVSCTLALIVIGICLLVSKVLCTSPILANVLFGKK